MRQLALWVVGAAEPHGRAGNVEPQHRAGVGAERGDGLAAGQLDVGEEALVALEESAFGERGQVHDAGR